MYVACNRKQRKKKTNQRYGKVKREEGKMRRGGAKGEGLTLELFQDTLNCAGAAAAAHGDVERVRVVVRHGSEG